MPFETADIVVVIVLIVSGLLAYFRGLVREVLSLATWIGAALAAYYSFPFLKPYARDIIGSKGVADAITGVALFVVALLILTLLNHAISGRVKDSALGNVDRGLGFLFGLARGALLVCVAYIVATWFWENDDLTSYIGVPRTMPYVRDGADMLRQIVPKNFKSETKSAAEEARRTANQAIQAERFVNPTRTEEDAKTPSYDKNTRRRMQHLIDTNRQRQ